MCAYPPSPEQSESCSVPIEVQLPSLDGIYISSLKENTLKHSLANWQETQRQSRPTLQRIDTEVAAPRLAVIAEQKSARYAHSHSVDFLSSVSLVVNDSGIDLHHSPSADSHDRDTPHFQRLMHFPISGPYISYSGRGNISAGTNNSSVSPNIFVNSPQTPSPDIDSPDTLIRDEDGDGDEEMDPENAWNLVPYNIPWGPSYHGYKSGSLPGPEGKCIFLRSPTPLKNQRTGQACEKCRERKAKCSGTRPSCARCIARGHVCEYGPEVKRSKAIDYASTDDEEEAEDSPINLALGEPSRTPRSRRIVGRDRRNTDSGPRTPATVPTVRKPRRHTVIAVPEVTFSTTPLRNRSPVLRTSRKRCDTNPRSVRPTMEFVAGSRPTDGRRGNDPLFSLPSDGMSCFPDSSELASNQLMSFGHCDDSLKTLAQCRLPSSIPHGSTTADQTLAFELSIDHLNAFAEIQADGQLHSPNPLRNSISMPRLYHTYQTPPPQDHDNAMYLATPDGYSTGTASTDGHDLEYDFIDPSPVVMQPAPLWRNGSIKTLDYDLGSGEVSSSENSHRQFSLETPTFDFVATNSLSETSYSSAGFSLMEAAEIQPPSISTYHRFAAAEWPATEEQLAMTVDHSGDPRTQSHSSRPSF